MRNVLLSGSIMTLSMMSFYSFTTSGAFDFSSATHAEKKENKGDEIKNLITKGSWKIQSVISDKACDTDGDGRETTNIASEMPSCALDDVMEVRPNGKVVFKRFERCYAGESAVESYNWTLTGDDKFIITKGSMEAEMIFRYVTKNELVLVIPSEAMGEMYYFTVTYKRPGK